MEKKILPTVLILLPLIGLSITALVMGSGKFWKCPGQPLVFTWLVGFGAIGILFAWFHIAIVVERTIHQNVAERSLKFGIVSLIIMISLFVFAMIWDYCGL